MDALTDLLRAVYWEPWQAILTLDLWWANLIIAILLMLKMVFGGWMLAKAGRSPLWVLVLLINGADIVALWVFAYVRWPFVDGARAAEPVSDAD
ncbi:hypothetical protein [Azospirillum sp. TSO22-1]|uniref:hypothetical protein n=1 Tax=Azospirillum sp. TSO22-1 TaxID=716789 RepID=UPI000D61D69D|nr:hypothetical protein [Azospirillum sp. TSO22-1]PWC55113.1 hypothetical protein TSO221_05705 [Azospirillum sp. TSO22-1]